MSETIDGLSLEIEVVSDKASEKLTTLNSRLEQLKSTVKSSTELSTFSRNFNKLTKAVESSAIVDASRIQAVGQFTQALDKLGNVKISSSLSNNLTKLSTNMEQMSDSGVRKVSEMSDALWKLTALQNFKFPRGLASGLEKIANLSANMQDVNFDKLNEMVSVLLRLQELAGLDTTSMNDLSKSMNNFVKASTQSTKRGRTFNTVLANIKTTTLALCYEYRKLAQATTRTFDEYGDYIETLNLFEVSMEHTGGKMYEFAEKAQNLLGIDMTQWMKAQGVFMALGKGFGIATDNAAIMSQQLTQLAYDISSFYNISVADAVQKVQSGFSGELEPVRRLGFDLSQAKLQAIALSMGIDKSVKSMTQAEKAQLRYIALMTQVKDVQGDLARTIQSPTNQLRILQAQLQQMYRSIGLMLLPALNNILPYLNAILKVIKWIAEEVAALFGYTMPKLTDDSNFGASITSGVEDMSDEMEEATGVAEKLKNTLASFDEINLITSSTDGSGKGGASALDTSAWDYEIPTYDFLGEASENRAQEIADAIKTQIQPALDKVKETILFIQKYSDEIKLALIAIASVAVLGSVVSKITEWKKKLDEIKKILHELKIALGVGLVIGGVTLSYSGGASAANGDIVESIIKTALGATFTAAGLSLLLNSAGAGFALSVPLSVIFFLAGYEIQQAKNIQESVDEIFFAFKIGKVSIDEAKQSWDNFVQDTMGTKLNTQPVIDARNDVIDVALAIQGLQANYGLGVISADQFVDAMADSFGRLKETLGNYLDAVGRLINEAFAGSLGVWMIQSGVTFTSTEELINRATENINNTVEEASKKIDEYTESYRNGTMSIEEYEDAIKSEMEKIDAFTGKIDTTDKAVRDFNEILETGVNFSSLDEAFDFLEHINTSYNQAMGTIKHDREELIASMEVMKAGAATEEDKAEWQRRIDLANQYYDEQTAVLKQKVSDAYAMLESESYERWDKVLDKEGLEHAVEFAGGKILELNEKISESADDNHIKRQKTVFSELVQGINDYDQAMLDAIANNDEYSKSQNDLYGKIDDVNTRFTKRFKELSDEYENSSYKLKDSMTETEQTAKRVFGNNIKGLQDMSKAVKTETDKQKGYWDGSFGNISGMIAELPAEFKESISNCADAIAKNQFGIQKSTQDIINVMADVLSDKDNKLANTLNATLNKDATTIKSESNLKKFKTSADLLMGEINTSFKDPNGKLKITLQGTIDKVKELNGSKYSQKGKELLDNMLASLNGDNSAPAQAIKEAVQNMKNVLEKNLDLGNTGETEGDKFIEKLKGSLEKGKSSIKTAADGVGKQMTDSMLATANTTLLYVHQMMMKMVAEWNDFEIKNGQAQFNGEKEPPKIIPVYANGGYPTSGDLFFANENGVAEYVGSMGNKSAVANNDQIIQGVSDGVYRALRETGLVEDVKKIAKKSSNVVFAPSEEAGRVMYQSADMYNATGGR